MPHRPSILLIDDSPGECELFRLALAQTGLDAVLFDEPETDAALHFLKAVKAIGTDDADKVMAQMKATRVNDMFARNGVIRPDGRMVHDMYLVQVKTPAESKYPWDYFKVLQTLPGDQVFMSKAESTCALWK